jgi:RNA-binding protein
LTPPRVTATLAAVSNPSLTVPKKAARRTSSPSRRAPVRKRSATVARERRASKPRESAAPSNSQRAAPVLAAGQRRDLRAQAHALSPLVQVGHGGVSAEVLTAVSRALQDHELIKVRLHEPEDKRGMAEALAEGTRSALCGLVGHTVILYRPHPKPRAPRTTDARRVPR